ncbi:uncharacterized protein LOC113562696 [Ooceraea biroi]|uniref:uncharacterized protein LOC113562696 n=1 Tax=Ooceraea biroi TaxID=2015173 RepID=UPI000F07C5F9|nr:uncharacterized protein LOC113562696 [Ooceraea biroi]
MLEWIGELDELRGRAKGLQKKINGDMKELLARIKIAAIELTRKSVETQERLSSDVREKEVAAMRTEATILKKENKELVKTIDKLHETNKKLAAENKQIGVELVRERTGRMDSREDMGREDRIHRRIWKKGYASVDERRDGAIRRKDIGIREPEKVKKIVKIMDSRKEKDRMLTEQIEELIARRRELRRGNITEGELEEQAPLPQRKRSVRTRGWATPTQQTEEESTDGERSIHFPPLKDSGEWTTIERRRRGERRVTQGKEVQGSTGWIPKKDEMKSTTRRRPPKAEAVWIAGIKDGPTGREILKRAKKEISLEELGIDKPRTRKTLTGATLLEISGEGSKEKADALAQKLKYVFMDRKVNVRRLVHRAELKIVGLDDDTTEEDVQRAIVKVGKGEMEDVKTGKILRTRSGIRIIWVTCPMKVAVEAAKEGRIRIGWTQARIELQETRPVRCFKCLETGHVRDGCTSAVDRTGICFKCGEKGHKVSECRNKAHCVVCSHKGWNANHRLGGVFCGKERKDKESGGMARRIAATGTDYEN